MGRVAIVLTFEEPGPDESLSEISHALMNEVKLTLGGVKDGRAWIGIRESADAIMRVTGEIT